MNFSYRVFNCSSSLEFNRLAIEIFHFQYLNNLVYQKFCKLLNVKPDKIDDVSKIPFLPIEFFKTHLIACKTEPIDKVFLSSGTTGQQQSKHYVNDIGVYEQSFVTCFEQVYGKIDECCVLALLPSYSERENSSLIYMVNHFIEQSNHPLSGYFLYNHLDLIETIGILKKQNQKTILIGVSYALLDFAEQYSPDLSGIIVMETGGMKGKRPEITKEELHLRLKNAFNVTEIHSEYGMTELLSQAYSKGNGQFNTPNWMKIVIRDTNDPLQLVKNNVTGGINVIDLANYNSCSFIATQDLGKINENQLFEVLGRFDNSDIRGCNLLIQ